MNYKVLLSEIEQADVITIFRHEHPDCDAVGSQFGLKNWILDNFPSKKVYVCGSEKCDQGLNWPGSDEVADMIVRESVAFVLDTANKERVDDQRFLTAKKIVKVDHHPDRSPFGDVSFVEESAAATCEILARFVEECSSFEVSSKTAEYLYSGLLTDTLNFTTSNTTAATLRAASFIAEHDICIPAIARNLFDKSLNGFKFSGFVRSNVQMIDNQIAYEVISIQDQENSNMTASKARSFIDELGHVRDFQIWGIFTEKVVDGKTLYDGSLRSKTIRINDIAEQFHGGGHPNAAGVKNLTKDDIQAILKQFQERVK